jgi:hypothetical protein
MSTDDNLYIKTDCALDEVAAMIAGSLGGRVQEAPDGEPCVSFDQVGDFPGWVTIFLSTHEGYLDPDRRDTAHGFGVSASVYYSKKMDEPQQEIARILVRRLVDQFPWPVILVHEWIWILAAFDPQLGYREYSAREVKFTEPYERIWLYPNAR